MAQDTCTITVTCIACGQAPNVILLTAFTVLIPILSLLKSRFAKHCTLIYPTHNLTFLSFVGVNIF